jgi:hypothetical protein
MSDEDETGTPAGHADEIFGDVVYEAALPARREFLPWHRPRKQYVREYQWLEQIRSMLEAAPRLDKTLKYLGLPGADLLDLRYFHEQICKPQQLGLRFLGFNTAANPANSAQTELNISLDEVRRLAFVDPRSDVLGDDFRGVANPQSLAWKSAFDLGPYDVINLDLCDGFGAHLSGEEGPPTHFDALNQLLALQARSKVPWLLLLTTRASEHHVDADVLQKFLDRYAENLANCPSFKVRSRELFGMEEVPAATSVGDKLLPVFLAGLCKWMLKLAIAQQPPTTIEVKSVIGYRVDTSAAHEDLISIALRFSPVFTPALDAMGLAQKAATPPDECALAVKAIGRIAKLRDADKILLEDATLRNAMIETTAKLLEVARYDPAAYRVWAAG